MKQDTVSILAIASKVPSTLSPPDHLDRLARKFVKPSPGLDKTIAVNHRTGIKHRPSVISVDDPIVNQLCPPKIDEINAVWMDKGMTLALEACEKAITDWGRPREEITHLICTTCTSSSHPGFDLHLLNKLPLPTTTERTLLHGIGCAGGVSLLRLARAQAIAAIHTPGAPPPRILIVACEVTSPLVRAELELLDQLQGQKDKETAKPNVAVTLFADAASAMIVGAGELLDEEHASFEILNCLTESVPETAHELGFDVHERGWRAILSNRVPSLTSAAVPTLFKRMLATTPLNPSPPLSYLSSTPSNHDWLIHPGGAAVLSALTRVLELNSPEEDYSQTGPSWEIYRERGNSSSAAIGGVIERSRDSGGREGCVAVAFGPGISVEMAVLRRTGWRGRAVNGAAGCNGRNGHALGNGYANGQANGHANGYVNGHTNGHNNSHINSHVKSLPNGSDSTRVSNTPAIGDISIGLKNAECVCLRSAKLFGGSGLDCWCRN